MAADPGDLFVIGRPPGITLVRPIDSVSRDDVGELRRLSGVAAVSGYQWVDWTRTCRNSPASSP